MSTEAETTDFPSSESATRDSDSSLSEQAQQGNIDAFELLVVKHQDRMVNIAFRLLGDYDDACECVQDAFIAAYESINSFRGDAQFLTWLTAITLNHARNRLKQMKGRSRKIGFSLNDPEETEDGTRARQVACLTPSALDLVEERDTRKVLARCVDGLVLEYREVFVLRDLQEFSYEEISSSLGLSAGTVKSRLFRARTAVRDCVKKAWGDQ